MDAWLEKSWEFQQQAYNQLGDRLYDKLKGSNELVEKLKVAFCYCYGDNYDSDEKKTEITEKVTSTALKFFNEGYSEYFSCTFINLKMKSHNTEGLSCVFWLYGSSFHNIVLLDLNSRNYNSWTDFIENNKFPMCYMMYPKDGTYYCHNNNDFKEITIEESLACTPKVILKDTTDVITTTAGLVAAGVLICNPVSAPLAIGAAVVSVISGLFSVKNSINKLVDIHYHDGGLSITDSKTLLATGELLMSGAGAVAVGAANGIKGAACMKTLSEGSLFYKIAGKSSTINRIVCAVNTGFTVLVLTEKFLKFGNLDEKDVVEFGKILLFTLNTYVSTSLIYIFIKKIASKFSIKNLMEYVAETPRRARSLVKNFCSYTSVAQLGDLINTVLPNFDPVVKKISNITPICNTVENIVCCTIETLKDKKFNTDFLYSLQKDLLALSNAIDHYKNTNTSTIEEKYGKETLQVIEEWTKNDPIDLSNTHSNYDNKINSPLQFNEQIDKTVDFCCRHLNYDIMFDQEKRSCNRKLLEKLLSVVKFHELDNDPMYLPAKMNYYCQVFLSLYRVMIHQYHFRHFLHVFKSKNNITKEQYFRKFYSVTSIYSHVFNLAFDGLEKYLQTFHEDFETKFVKDKPNENHKQYISEFQIPSTDFSKDKLYCRAKLLIPHLEFQLTEDLTTFDFFDNLGIIKSKKDKFMLFFYVTKETKIQEETYKNCILFTVENFVK